MNHSGAADSARIECDEDGFHLIVETDEGDHFDFRIHDIAADLYWNARKTIGSWLSEQDAARFAAKRLTEEDLEGYELGDPKRVELQRIIDRDRSGWR